MFDKGIFFGEKESLFRGRELRSYFEEIETRAFREINSLSSDYLLKTNVRDVVQYLIDRYLITIPGMLEDKVTAETETRRIDVRGDFDRPILNRNEPAFIEGSAVQYFIPFEGDSTVFNCQILHFQLWYPKGYIQSNNIVFSVVYPPDRDVNEEDNQKAYQENLNNISDLLKQCESEVKQFNDQLKNRLEQKLNFRKNKALKDSDIAAKLNVPIRRKENTPNTYSVPVIRKKVTVKKPVPLNKSFVPEPELDIAIYEDILNIVSNMSKVMEQSPKTFRNINEEVLRTHFLVQLNAQFEGQATAETFNCEGKTDIIIKNEGKNIFIAECAFWNGEKYLIKKIDQLLGYTCWRDTKTAIFLFNKRKDLSKVLEQIPDVVENHRNYKRTVENYQNETKFRFILHHNDDKNRELTLTVLVFEVPT